MSCSNVQIEYDGNGVRVDYTFPFTYEDELEVHVGAWDETKLRFVDVERDTWSFQNATTIRFTDAPDGKFIIYRKTDLDELEVTFYPGSSIRAQDLNANFEQLRDAIQEGWCRVSEEFYEYLDEYIWDVRDAITYDDQINDRWGNPLDRDVPRIATDRAIAARHDTYLTDNLPTPLPHEQPGKRWYDTNIPMNYIWNDQIEAWVDYSRMGPQGPRGADGHHQVLMGTKPPTKRPNGQDVQDGDIWFNTCIGEVYIYYDGQWITLAAGGPRGEQGVKGDRGPAGPASDVAGPEGPKGDTGTYQTICSLTAPKTRVDGSDLQCGDIWFNTCKGEAFIYYDGKWLSFGSGGSKGEPGEPGSKVWVGTRPPDDRELYPLWVNTDCPNTGLYFYDGDYWVGASIPGPQGPAGQDGDGNYVFIAPLQQTGNNVSFAWNSINALPN